MTLLVPLSCGTWTHSPKVNSNTIRTRVMMKHPSHTCLYIRSFRSSSHTSRPRDIRYLPYTIIALLPRLRGRIPPSPPPSPRTPDPACSHPSSCSFHPPSYPYTPTILAHIHTFRRLFVQYMRIYSFWGGAASRTVHAFLAFASLARALRVRCRSHRPHRLHRRRRLGILSRITSHSGDSLLHSAIRLPSCLPACRALKPLVTDLPPARR
ncbi:hypothetical protein BD414DRAFT_487173 [Trametes punicea]|nr:hypothetical protein BD414DRAFT_487173 [Trametes punicea]